MALPLAVMRATSCDGVNAKMICLFFFSSRRRHTSSTRDWSSDVCSSDLDLVQTAQGGHAAGCPTDDVVVIVQLDQRHEETGQILGAVEESWIRPQHAQVCQRVDAS